MKRLTPTNIRTLIRSLSVLATSFGFGLTGVQVASISLVVEAILRIAYKSEEK